MQTTTRRSDESARIYNLALVGLKYMLACGTMIATKQRCPGDGANIPERGKLYWRYSMQPQYTMPFAPAIKSPGRYTRTPEIRAKLSAARKGKPSHLHSDETKRKMSAAQKGHAVSEQTKARISAAKLANRPTLEERFWRQVDKNGPIPPHAPELGPCWIWTGQLNRYGYGDFHPRHNFKKLAHRYAWSLVNGPIPEGLILCHHCDTPACARPDHCWPGTHKENRQDSIQKGRGARSSPSPEVRAKQSEARKQYYLKHPEARRYLVDLARERGEISADTRTKIRASALARTHQERDELGRFTSKRNVLEG